MIIASLVERVLAWEAGQHDAVLDWLKGIGCAVVPWEVGPGWWITGCRGVRIGLTPGQLPTEVAMSLGKILAGAMWQQVYPGLLAAVEKDVVAEREGGGQWPA
jgi:hypothetical protein